jgi:hypothetical protein
MKTLNYTSQPALFVTQADLAHFVVTFPYHLALSCSPVHEAQCLTQIRIVYHFSECHPISNQAWGTAHMPTPTSRQLLTHVSMD